MKKHYFKNMIALVISMIMLFSDIAVFATNNEETIGKINQKQNLEYSTYWDNPNFSNLVVFVGMSEVGNYEDISEIKRGLDEVRDHFYSVSEGELMIENIVPQYDINNDEMPLFVLENSYEYYIEDEAKLIDEVVQYLNESAIISDTINLHYSSHEDVLDNLTIIALGESVNEVLVSHVGTYEGEANVKEHSIHDYILLTEQDLVDLEQGITLEIMSEVLEGTNLTYSLEQSENNISTTTEITYEDTEEKTLDIMNLTNTGWYQENENWYYTQEDGCDAVGITEIDGKKYYFDSDNCLRSGWQKIDGIRYFFAVESTPQDCYMLCEVQPKAGWVEMSNGDKCYASEGGSVVAGWQTIDGQKYYFDSYGILQKDWLDIDGKWYYADENGKIAEGLSEIDGKKYYFDSLNGLKKGWVKVGTIRYFFAVKEAPQECYQLCKVLPQPGWVEMSNGDKCYASEGGSVVAGWQTIDGQKYYFDSYGILQKDWLDIDGKWYYADENGKIAEGLSEIDGKKYYFDSLNGLKKGWVKVGTIRYFSAVKEAPQECYQLCKVLPQAGWVEMSNGDKCYASEGGSVVAGWKTIDGQKYYFDSYGIQQTGWFTIGNAQYYGDETTGIVASGLKEINGKTYGFHENSNYLLTGISTINEKKYCFDSYGILQKDWLDIDGKWYYADENGKIAEGLSEIDGKTYYFDGLNGLKKGWVKVGTIRYFFAVKEAPQECYQLCKVLPQPGWVEMSNGDKCYASEGGSVVAGWQTIDGQKYYFDSYGIQQIGWFTIGNAQYYGDETTGIVASGLKEINGKIYGFHESSNYLLTGIRVINGKKYCFDSKGILQTGWIKSGSNWYYTDANGEPAEGLSEIDGKKYYFDSLNGLKKGWVKVGTIRYFFAVEEDPQECYQLCKVLPQSGWVEMANGDKCYASEGGSVVAGWQTIDRQKYYFDSYGIQQTGWFTIGNAQYYGDETTGIVASGLKEINGKIYGFHESSNYLLTGISVINGKKYCFDSKGILQTGWIKSGSNWYYTDANGEPAEGLSEIDGKTYYFDSLNGLKKGWVKVGTIRYFFAVEEDPQECYQLCRVLPQSGWVEMSNGDKCYASEGGSVVAGWQTIDGQKYYFDSYGIQQTGWIKDGNNWYYADEKGKIAEGLTEIDGKRYHFNGINGLTKGWVRIGAIRYFFAVEEEPQECYQLCKVLPQAGWVEMSNGDKCYATTGGSVVAGWQIIDGKQYYFDSYGIMQTGWQTINGSKYFFNIEGIYIPMSAPEFSSITSESYGTITVRWKQVTGVKGYILEYSEDESFGDGEDIVIEFEGDSVNEYRIESLESGQRYYFRMKYTVLSGTQEVPEEIHSQYSVVKSRIARDEVEATATSAQISECQIVSGSRDSGITIQLNATLQDRLKSADDKYYIVETESYGTEIDLTTPIGSVDKAFSIDEELSIGDVDRALMNKFALAVLKEDGTYQVISTPMGITNPETVAENTVPILKPTSKKGLQGIGYAGALDTNSKNTLFNLDLATVVGTGPATGYVEYEYKGKTYYFSTCNDLVAELKALDEGIMQYAQGVTGNNNKVCVTLNLLLSYKASNAYLIDPAARTSGHKYYTLNVREENARETFEALFLYLGELFGQRDCYVTHWILGNEVNSSRAWNYQGSLSFDEYMQSYATAFRLLYNGVKASKTGNNVYISLDNGWTAAPDTYAGKTTLDSFAAYAQLENPDMLWSIAYHGYSYPLTRVDFWNDNTYTISSTSTKYISMKNIAVLTNYAVTLEQKYEKSEGSIRVILSEQGYTATGKYDMTAEEQARALARGYYIAEFNDRIDAFIIRAINDDIEEMKGSLYFGLKTAASLDVNYADKKRVTFYVYEYMDSSIEAFTNRTPGSIASSSTNQGKVRTAQSILGGTTWESIIPGFSRSKLTEMY